MANTNLFSNPLLKRARWIALPAALFTAGGALLFWRREQNEPVPVPSVDAVQTAVTTHQPSLPQRRPQSPLRWFLFLIGVALCAGLFIFLQADHPELSAAIFMLLLLGCLLYVVFRSAAKISHNLQNVRLMVAYPHAVLEKNAAGLSLVSGGAAVVFALWSALVFWDSRSYSELQNQGAVLFILSLLALWAAFALRPSTIPMMTIALDAPVAEPKVSGFKSSLRLFIQRFRTRLMLFMGVVLLLLISEINGLYIKSDLLSLASINVQFVLLVAGTGLIIVGLTGVVSASAATKPTQSRLERWKPLWPLALITLLALLLRFWHLDLAMRFLVDERSFIDGTYDIRSQGFVGLLQPFSGISAFPYVYPYWQTLSMNLFGWSLFGLRAPSAILGTLGIPAAYFLVRTLFDRKTAILAALILATFPPHIQFSRIAICEISSPFFATMAFAFLARAMQQGQRRDFVLGGVMLGFTHYFHEGGRLLFTPLAVIWLVGCVLFMQVANLPPLLSPLQRIKLHWQRVRPGLLLALAALVLIATPIYLTLIGINRPIFARLVDNHSGLTGNYWQELLTTPDALSDHITYHVLPAFEVLFNHEDSTLFYSQTTALLLTGVLPFVIVGFAFACYHWRKPGPMLLVLWVLCTSMGNSFMKDSTGSPRFVMVFPALAILAAVALRYVVPLVLRRVRWQWLTMVAISLLLAAYQFNFFFNQHLPEYNFIFRSTNAAPDGYDAAWRSLNFPLNTQVHMISSPDFNQIEAEGLVRIWRKDITVDTMISRRLTPKYLKNLTCDVDHAFFIQWKDTKTLNMLRAYFKLSPPRYTPFTDVAPFERFVLFYAANNPEDGSLYSHYCHPPKTQTETGAG
ncbi:MAG: phospholipid carrier-dependent glycosyltransferase [Anaerolineaceae bacterium]|nr:phospholipid carrier-dependent glycosyltransferase [Anaerolineaceae bacterium]